MKFNVGDVVYDRFYNANAKVKAINQDGQILVVEFLPNRRAQLERQYGVPFGHVEYPMDLALNPNCGLSVVHW